MRNRFIHVRPVMSKTFLFGFALLAFLTLVAPQAAQAALAGTAGNTIIRNTVTVNFKDNAGNVQTAVTASVDVSVTTVAAAPTVLSFTPTAGSTDGTGATQAYTVRIRTNSNGPGTVSFATADGTFTNIAAGTAPTVPGNIFLGATIIDPSDSHIGASPVVAANATITFNVPNDNGVPTDSATSGGSIGDGVVNALKSGDIVYIYTGSTYYGPFTVGTVTDIAVGTGTTAAPDSIQLTNSSGASITLTSVAAGWQLLEAKDVTVTVTQGTITNTASVGTWVTTVTATMSGLNGTNTVTTTGHVGHLSVTKQSSTDGINWQSSGTSVAPGGTIYYLIMVSNTGTGNATNVVLTDPQPTYTTYTAGSGRRATGATAVNYSAASTTLTDASAADDGYDFSVTTANTITYTIGTIASGTANTVQLLYKVTVN